MITEQELPKNEPITVFDYFVSCMFEVGISGSVILAQTPQTQVQYLPWSTILRLPTQPISYEAWESLQLILIELYKKKFPNVNVKAILVQTVSLLGQFNIPNATIYSQDDLQGRSFITPDSKIILKDEDNDETIY